jgi:hypothetical protein
LARNHYSFAKRQREIEKKKKKEEKEARKLEKKNLSPYESPDAPTAEDAVETEGGGQT